MYRIIKFNNDFSRYSTDDSSVELFIPSSLKEGEGIEISSDFNPQCEAIHIVDEYIWDIASHSIKEWDRDLRYFVEVQTYPLEYVDYIDAGKQLRQEAHNIKRLLRGGFVVIKNEDHLRELLGMNE